jgi:hypothetical protein
MEVSDGPEGTEDTISAIHAKHLRYKQVDITAGPARFDGWFPSGLTPQGEVIGQASDCNDDFSVCTQHVLKRRLNGEFIVLEENFSVNDVNSRGDAGGCTIEPGTFRGQAGVVRENGRLELIPPLPGEMQGCVIRVSDARTALFVASTDDNFVTSVYILDRNRMRPFPVLDVVVNDINDRAQVAGIQFTPDLRAYRFDSRTQTTTILQPVPPDPFSMGFAINRDSEVLGFSLNFDGSSQRVGKWNRNNRFEISFVSEPPNLANNVHWNESGLIVVSGAGDGNTFVVPAPGVSLNLADLVKNAQAPAFLGVIAVNQRGDIVGAAEASVFLFLRD